MNGNGSKQQPSSVTSGKKAPPHIHALFGDSTGKAGLDADWNQVDPEVLVHLLWAVCYFGGSVTLGATRNGKAYSVKVYIGEPFSARYFDGDEEGRTLMREWVDQLVIAAAESA